MILGAFWFLVANAAVLLGAHEILGRLKTGRPPLDALLFLLIRLAIISGAVILAGLTHTLTPTGLGVAGTAALAMFLALGIHKKLNPPAFPEVGFLAGVLAALVAARLLSQVWFFSPRIGDALAYHLPKVAEWVRAGAFTREMGVDTHVTFPAGFEVVETWWVVFWRHDVLIEMAGVEFLAVAFMATYVLARRLDLGEKTAFLAALLYAMTPGLHLQATSCLNDGPAAALVVATAALIAARAPLGLVLLAAGLGVGIKPTYGYALPGMAVLWFLVRRDPSAGPGSNRVMAALAAVGLAVGGFWYARNLVWYGSPTYPVGRIGLDGRYPIQFGPRLASLQGNLRSLAEERIYDAKSPCGALVSDISGWGAAAFACGLVALLRGLQEDARIRRLAGAFALSLLGVFTFTICDPWSMRFVLFFPALLSVVTARLVQSSRAMAAVAGIALVLQFFGTILPADISIDLFYKLGRQPWRQRSMAPVFGVRQDLDAVGYFGDYRTVAYLLYGPDFSCRVAYLRPASPEGLIEDMRRADVRLLYAGVGAARNYRLIQECQKRGLLERVGESYYRLK